MMTAHRIVLAFVAGGLLVTACGVSTTDTPTGVTAMNLETGEVDTFDSETEVPSGWARIRRQKSTMVCALQGLCCPRPVPNDHQRPASRDERAISAVRAPSHAERARTLVSVARSATLSTIARDPVGYPYGSLVTIASDDRGRPLLLLSTLAEHTGNLNEQPNASALVSEPVGSHEQPLALGRVTLLGRCVPVPEDEKASVRATFLEQQPSAAYYVDFGDFGFYRLEPTALRYVGGFGRMSWITADEYRTAEPDPLGSLSAGILKHMNEDHADACLLYACSLLGVPDATAATMTAVDRYGFELAVATPSGPRAVRWAFDEAVVSSDQVRHAMVALVKRARSLAPSV